MDPGLRGDDLPLQAGQEPFTLAQGQTQAGQVGEVAGPGDPQDIGAVLLSLGTGAHQSHDPGHVASTSPGKTGPRIPPSALAPPISRRSRIGSGRGVGVTGVAGFSASPEAGFRMSFDSVAARALLAAAEHDRAPLIPALF